MLEGFTWFRQSAYLWKGDGLPSPSIPGTDVRRARRPDPDHPCALRSLPARRDRKLSGPATKVVAPRSFAADVPGDVTPVEPGDSVEVAGVKIQAVPAYNVAEERLEMHPKANNWVGYVSSSAATPTTTRATPTMCPSCRR